MEKSGLADQNILLYVGPDHFHLAQTDAFYERNK